MSYYDIGEIGLTPRRFERIDSYTGPVRYKEVMGQVWGYYRGVATEQDVACWEHVQKYREKYGEPKCGRHRATFDLGNGYVVKVPHMASGEDAILTEAIAYEVMDDTSIPLPECYLAVSEFDPSMTVLIMEKVRVDVEFDRGSLPAWVDTLEDFPQIGLTKMGRIVAYDI